MPTNFTIPKSESYLRGYVRDGDADLEPARERARRAAAGEVVRRRVNDEPELRVRIADGSLLTTDGRERVVVGHEGRAIAKREDVQP